MAEILLHSETYGELTLATEVPCLIVRWHGFANSENFRFLLNKGLEVYRLYSARYPNLAWLNDSRKFGAMRSADQRWLNTDWNPRAYLAGIRQVNFLSPENVFGQIAVQHYTHNTTSHSSYQLEVQHYTTFEEAQRSLRQL